MVELVGSHTLEDFLLRNLEKQRQVLTDQVQGVNWILQPQVVEIAFLKAVDFGQEPESPMGSRCCL